MNKASMIFMVAAVAFVVLAGCETNDDKTIQAARACTDNAGKMAFSNPTAAATAATVCQANIVASGIGTTEANKIMFGNLLIMQQKMAGIGNLVNTMKSRPSGGQNGLAAALPILIYTTGGGAADTTAATNAQTYANNSGSAGLMTLGNLIYASTMLSSLQALTSGSSAAAVVTAVTNCAGGTGCSAADQQNITNAALGLKAAACASPSDQASTDPTNLCYKAKQMTCSSTVPATVLNCMSTYLNQPN